MKVEQLLIGADEAARRLSVGRSLFYTMLSDGRLGPLPISFGKRKLWSVEELRQWIRADCPVREKWMRLRNGDQETS